MRYANIRYSTLLNEAQYDYLSDECQDINRMKCFKTFIRRIAGNPIQWFGLETSNVIIEYVPLFLSQRQKGDRVERI